MDPDIDMKQLTIGTGARWFTRRNAVYSRLFHVSCTILGTIFPITDFDFSWIMSIIPSLIA
jgi:hypothetical protein